MWITLSNVADRFLVFAKTDTSKGAGGITAFILERGWMGLTTGTIEGKMGVRASNTGWISMHEVRVPKSHMLGLEGEGFKIAMSALDNARYGVAAGAVGVMKACLDESISYAKQRQTFGKPIAEYQLVQQMIANMQQSIDIGQLLVWKAGWLKNQGKRNTRETSMAKWYCTEAAFRSASDAVQIHGAYGYSDEYNVERHLRNSKSAVIYEGTSQIHTLMQAAYAMAEREDKPLRCPMPAYDPVTGRRRTDELCRARREHPHVSRNTHTYLFTTKGTHVRNILVRQEGRVGVVQLNRPKALNALNSALMDELIRCPADLRPR